MNTTITSVNKLKFVGHSNHKIGLYEAGLWSPRWGAVIEATGEEVLRINPLRLEPAELGASGGIITIRQSVSLK
jgi:hypothetical protein